MSDVDPQTDVEARLRQIRDEIDRILDGESARKVDGRTAGSLEDINAVVFGMDGREADMRVTKEKTDGDTFPLLILLGYLIDGMAAGYGYPPNELASLAIQIHERIKESGDRTASISTEVLEDE